MAVYAERDGQGLFRLHAGVLGLLDAPEDLPGTWTQLGELTVDGLRVIVVRPDDPPSEVPTGLVWVPKDGIPTDPRASPLVRQVVNRSLVRAIANALVEGPEGILQVLGSSGFTAGQWHLPGGFVELFEDPEDAVVRELREETGLEVEVIELLGVSTIVPRTIEYTLRGFLYHCRITGGILDPDPAEVAEVRWLSREEMMPILERMRSGNPRLREPRAWAGRAGPGSHPLDP